jgi:hypothetical protein
MRETLISVKHHVDDYECMWNGIEALYLTKSGETIPDFFFFSLSGIWNFVSYITPQSEVKRHAVERRTNLKMYERLRRGGLPLYTYRRNALRLFAESGETKYRRGRSVVLGCLVCSASDIIRSSSLRSIYHPIRSHVGFTAMKNSVCFFMTAGCRSSGISYPDLKRR